MKVNSVGPPNPDNLPEDGKLKSEVMVKDNRRYYLDLKENSRGRFLRVICDGIVLFYLIKITHSIITFKFSCLLNF